MKMIVKKKKTSKTLLQLGINFSFPFFFFPVKIKTNSNFNGQTMWNRNGKKWHLCLIFFHQSWWLGRPQVPGCQTVLAPACSPCKTDHQSSFHCPLRAVWTLNICPTCSRYCKPMWLRIQCSRQLLPINHSSTLIESEVRWTSIQIKLRVQCEKKQKYLSHQSAPFLSPFPLSYWRKSKVLDIR